MAMLACAAVGPAGAQEKRAIASEVTRTTMEVRPIEGTDQEMRLVQVVIPPGMSVPAHHHTVGGLNYIVSGTAESAYGDGPVEIFRAGQSLQDIPATTHRIFRNPDTRAELRFLIFYTIKTGQPYTVLH